MGGLTSNLEMQSLEGSKKTQKKKQNNKKKAQEKEVLPQNAKVFTVKLFRKGNQTLKTRK